MKYLITFALVLAVVGFIHGQFAPPQQQQQCVTPTAAQTNGTFCGALLTYLVKNGTDFNAKNTAANGAYTTALAAIPAAQQTQACKDALTAYYCQSNFGRCGPYTDYTQVKSTRCSAVNTACNVTNFPQGFSGSPCIANGIISVDGPAAVCISGTITTLNSACVTGAQLFNVNFTGNAALVNCPLVSTCNPNSNTCTRPNQLNDACTGTCITGPAQPGSALSCISGKCQYSGKRAGYACTVGAECLSGNCNNSMCSEQQFGQACNLTTQCAKGLYCDTFNSTCYYQALNNQPCGQLQTNWSPVPCTAGFTCVRSNPNATATCQANANIGGACAPPTGAIVYPAPLCGPSTLPTTGSAQCVNSVCSVVSLAPLGASCNATNQCVTSATCNWATPQGGVCVAPSAVACDSVAASSSCNLYQTCSCTSLGSQGTCAIDTTNPLGVCAGQSLAIQQCLLTNCNGVTDPFFPYDGYSCGATKCVNQINQYFCCLKGAVGANWVAPAGSPADPCATPSPTPGPTGTGGPTGTATPVPVRSSRKSGASLLSVDVRSVFIAMIIAIVAFCL